MAHPLPTERRRSANATYGRDIDPPPPTSVHSIGYQVRISRAIQLIKKYLERSNDINIAVRCLETLVRAGSILSNRCDPIHQRHLLETIAVVIDVLRNHHQDVQPSLRRLALQYVNTNEFSQLYSTDSPDVRYSFLVKCVCSGVTFSLEQTEHSDTFPALIFDVSSILLSHCKYDVLYPSPLCLTV
jgi:hypothetical protein